MKALKLVLLIGLLLIPLTSYADFSLDVQLPQYFETDYTTITQYGAITGDLISDSRLETVVTAQGNVYFNPNQTFPVQLAKIFIIGLNSSDQHFIHELPLNLGVLCPEYDDDNPTYNVQIVALRMNTPPFLADVDGDGKNEVILYLSKMVRYNRQPNHPTFNQNCPFYTDNYPGTDPHSGNCYHFAGVLAAYSYNESGSLALKAVSEFKTPRGPRTANATPVAYDFDQDGNAEIALCGYSNSRTDSPPPIQPIFFEIFKYSSGEFVRIGYHALDHPRGMEYPTAEYPLSVAIGNIIQTSPDIDVAVSS